MEIVKKLLFGKKVFIEDPILGTFDTRIKSQNPSIERTWTSEHLIPNQKEKTVFILEGNINGPTKKHREYAHRIVEELERITKQLDLELAKNCDTYSKFNDWLNTFHFAALTPWIEHANEFELCFNPVDENDKRYISCIWSNGRILDVEAK